VSAPRKTVLLVVAHPDDETLFAGGTIIVHPDWDFHVVTLCRGSDPDRRPRFHEAMARLGVLTSSMGDADDAPQQVPLADEVVQGAIESLLHGRRFDLVITHSLVGEYTSHRRHGEVGRAVVELWKTARLACDQLWMFAYADSGQGTYPVALPNADFIVPLPAQALEAKRAVLSLSYNFGPNSWESLSMPTQEAFWCFDDPQAVAAWHQKQVLESKSNTLVDWGRFR
jgi:LmbE family N-acetylglucosaminyl deacetylase